MIWRNHIFFILFNLSFMFNAWWGISDSIRLDVELALIAFADVFPFVTSLVISEPSWERKTR